MQLAQAPTTSEAAKPSLGLLISLLVVYGHLIGGIYLVVFWGRFGLQPFQHGGVSELVPAGIAAVAAIVVFVFLGAGVGQAIGRRLNAPDVSPKLAGAVALVMAAILAWILICGPKWRYWLAIGLVLQILLPAMLMNLELLPERLRTIGVAVGIGVSAGYAPAAAAFFAHTDADKAMSIDSGQSVSGNSDGVPNLSSQALKYVGRLREDIVLYDPCKLETSVFRVRNELVLVLRKMSSSEPLSCVTNKTP